MEGFYEQVRNQKSLMNSWNKCTFHINANTSPVEFTNRFPYFNRAVAVIAYMFRFVSKCKGISFESNMLTAAERNAVFIRHIQNS